MDRSGKAIRLIGIAAAALLIGGVARAQDRTGEIDTYGSIGYIGGTSGSVNGRPGLHFDLDSAWQWGFGGGYHFTDQWSYLLDMQFGYTTLAISSPQTPAGGTWRQNADYFQGRFNVEYTPMPGRISPVLSAGIGWFNFRTAIPGAPPQTICAPGFYYWWCGTGVPTYDETAFSWNAGLGLRFDVTPSLMLKLMYTATWADFSIGTEQFNQVTLQIVGKFQH
jgi:opacity protein-like surface antigen